MTPFDRHLLAATGYLELGMPLDANESLEDIDAELRVLPPVLVVRLEIYRTLEKWELMEIIAKRLCKQRPDDPQWFISLAFATRRAEGLQEAVAVLARVANRFPSCATILYNLACYAAQLGHLDVARNRLAEAAQLDSACHELAKTDPDLAPLR
jgi:predicted Zn-dependent protease